MFEVTALLLLQSNSPNSIPSPLMAPMALAVAMQQPDTKKAVPLARWPNQQDIDKLQSAEGKPGWMVLLILGHPSFVERRADGSERWHYPWQAACLVWIENGVCTGTFYTAGF